MVDSSEPGVVGVGERLSVGDGKGETGHRCLDGRITYIHEKIRTKIGI